MSLISDESKEIEKDEDNFGLGCALELFSEFKEIMEMIDNLNNVINSQRSITERAYERFLDILKQYQEQPHLLDSHLDEVLGKMIDIVRSSDSSMKLKHETFKYIYIVINVRGYKVIVRHLPHEVADFEPVLQLLESQDSTDSETWTTRYVLLLWLSIIVMIPFHMSRLDAYDSADDKNKTVMSRVLDICKTYTVVSDKCRDAAAYLASKFLTRNDVKENHLTPFFDWACELSISKDSSVFIKYGTLASVAMILKHGKREDLLPHARRLLQWIIDAEFKHNPGSNIQKLVYKIIQRIGLTFLPPRMVSWRYQRGNRSLTANLSAGDDIKPKTIAETSHEPHHEVGENLENIDVPDEVEEVIDQLMQGLGSSDSVVRWSAAKGIGRVTSRLSKDLADEVVGSILELFSPRESDGAWQGGCLALAELGRRGLLLPQRLPEVVPLILKALVYDEPRGYSSVGSHIRDSACYVCWSFARAYETHILKPFVNEIACALLVVTCFDREINCRRAASAAFQENVGRQGTFPYGIDILTTADFFAVSVRNNSYLNISVFIAQFEEYTLSLINHLLEKKIDHWDITIRELTAKALHNLTAKSPEYMINSVLPMLFEKSNSIDLNSRHGSVLAIGDILYSLSIVAEEQGVTIEEFVGNETLTITKNLVHTFRERLYFRGMGGELMKQACSSFIQKCSLAHLPFHKTNTIEDWLQLLNECLSYDVSNVRASAIAALPALFMEYYHGGTPDDLNAQASVIRNYVKELQSTNLQIARMGHALALGSIPCFMLKPFIEQIIVALIDSTAITPSTLKWAESRRDAIKALTSICVTLEKDIAIVLTEDHVTSIFNCFLTGLTEYTQDNRGDIGAWVREASMVGLQTLTLLQAKHNREWLNSEIVCKVITGIAQQSVEKIDRTRALAGKIFYNLIHSEPHVPHIPEYYKLTQIFPKEECELLNWNSAAITFPKFVKLIEFNSYKYNLLLGLVTSVGGMTETLVKNSSHSFFEMLKYIEEKRGGPNEIIDICEIVYQIFTEFQRVDRITIPMFRFLDKLFSSGCINCVLNNPNSDFPRKVLRHIQVEINGCKDIYKLIDGLNVLCQFLQIKTDVCSIALVQLSILLCHRQSYVRRSTSTRLYESLLVYGDNSIIPEENLDEVMNLLSSTNWEDPIEEIRPIRNNLCTLMGIRIPIAKKRA